MIKRYFPHYSEDGSQTQGFNFNIMPNMAVSSDPRTIITEWSQDALKTLMNSEVYVGQKIFCQADAADHICLWVPEKGTYTGNDCVWKEEKLEPDWIDVSTYTPTQSVSELIAEKKATQWKYVLKQYNSYCGFYDFKGDSLKDIVQDPEKLNQMLKQVVMYSDTQNKNYISNTYPAMATKDDARVVFKVSDNPPSTAAKTAAINTRFVVVVPSRNRDKNPRVVDRICYGDDGNWKGDIEFYEKAVGLEYMS